MLQQQGQPAASEREHELRMLVGDGTGRERAAARTGDKAASEDGASSLASTASGDDGHSLITLTTGGTNSNSIGGGSGTPTTSSGSGAAGPSSEEHFQKETVSFTRAVMNMVLCGLGAGILSLPWTTAGAGLLNAAFWNFTILSLSYYTMMMMVRCGEKYQLFDMEALLNECDNFPKIPVLNLKISGKHWKSSCAFAIWGSYWLALVGYIIIIVDSVMPTVAFVLGVPDTVPPIPRVIPVVGGGLVILPLCFLSQKKLALTSTLGVFSNCFVVFAVGLNYFVVGGGGGGSSSTRPMPRPSPPCLLGFTKGNITYVSAICMAMVIQPCVLPMYETLERRSPQRFSQLLLVSFGILWLLFSVFSTFAYLTYGEETKGNVLSNLPEGAWYSVIARAGMALVAAGVYPLMLFPMLAPIKNEKLKRISVFGILLSTMIAALSFTDLGILNVACGALSTFFFIALYPVVIGVSLDEHENGGSRTSTSNSRVNLKLAALFVLGTLSAVMGLLMSSDNGAKDLVKHCAWCVGSGAATRTSSGRSRGAPPREKGVGGENDEIGITSAAEIKKAVREHRAKAVGASVPASRAPEKTIIGRNGEPAAANWVDTFLGLRPLLGLVGGEVWSSRSPQGASNVVDGGAAIASSAARAHGAHVDVAGGEQRGVQAVGAAPAPEELQLLQRGVPIPLDAPMSDDDADVEDSRAVAFTLSPEDT